MKNENYYISITVNADAQQATEAINNVAAWWTANVEGSSSKLNDVFTVRFGETYVMFKITEFIPDNKIEWYVTDSNVQGLKDKKEWNNTTIDWKIDANNDSTKITMTHIGLQPNVECYEMCIKGWNFYTGISLLKLINEGEGLPDTPHAKRTAQVVE